VEAASLLDAHRPWLAERARQVNYSARILWQELRAQRGFAGGYGNVRRAVAPLRLAAAATAITQRRFETGPAEQAQCDWVQVTVALGDARTEIHIFVMTPAYSRRGFMFALGCTQAQTCHTGQCPTGVTTQDPLRQRAIVVPDKAERVLRFHQGTLQALRELTQAAGLMHPGEIRAAHIVRRTPDGVRLLSESLQLLEPGELLAAQAGQAPWPSAVFRQYWPRASARSFGLV
jgi:hypothetical protein